MPFERKWRALGNHPTKKSDFRKGSGGRGGCAICDSMEHWKNECPEKPDAGKGYVVALTLTPCLLRVPNFIP